MTINELAELPENWDSYGSRSIQEKALTVARHIIQEINTRQLPLPRAYPVPGGGIQLEWCILGRGELEVEILPDGSIEFLEV